MDKAYEELQAITLNKLTEVEKRLSDTLANINAKPTGAITADQTPADDIDLDIQSIDALPDADKSES